MRLASWVSIAVIGYGVIIFFLFISANGPIALNIQPLPGKEYVIYGLATLTISEIFRNLKDTKSGDHHAKN